MPSPDVSREFDLDTHRERIASTAFFSRLGQGAGSTETLVFVADMEAAFGGTLPMTLLPSSNTETDPFYQLEPVPADLRQQRVEITRLLYGQTRHVRDLPTMTWGSHLFGHAAQEAVVFAFRQLVLETAFDLGDMWQRITELYYLGHWPFGHDGRRLYAI